MRQHILSKLNQVIGSFFKLPQNCHTDASNMKTHLVAQPSGIVGITLQQLHQ